MAQYSLFFNSMWPYLRTVGHEEILKLVRKTKDVIFRLGCSASCFFLDGLYDHYDPVKRSILVRSNHNVNIFKRHLKCVYFKLDPHATEAQYGTIVASYNFASMVTAPIFGWCTTGVREVTFYFMMKWKFVEMVENQMILKPTRKTYFRQSDRLFSEYS